METDFKDSQDYLNIKNKIFDYLGRQDCSEKKLIQKVCDLKKNYPQTKRYENYDSENVLIVIEDLKKEGIIDEVKFLQNMIELSLDSKYGLNRIKQKMYQKLYKKENIEKVFKDFQENPIKRDFTRIIKITKQKREFLLKKYPQESDYDINQRLFAFLAQKGFEFNEVGMILKNK